jgi:hypothetical protein
MNEKELKEFKASLDQTIREVQTSKAAARKLLNRLGMLTPTGKLKKSFVPTHVSR